MEGVNHTESARRSILIPLRGALYASVVISFSKLSLPWYAWAGGGAAVELVLWLIERFAFKQNIARSAWVWMYVLIAPGLAMWLGFTLIERMF